MIEFFFILFMLLIVLVGASVEFNNPLLAVLGSIAASVCFGVWVGLILKKQKLISSTNHIGYTIDTVYTVKNNVRVGVTYHIKEKGNGK